MDNTIPPEINRAIEECVKSLPSAYRLGAIRDLSDAWLGRETAPNYEPFRLRSLSVPFDGEWRRLETRWHQREGFWICSSQVIIHSGRSAAKLAPPMKTFTEAGGLESLAGYEAHYTKCSAMLLDPGRSKYHPALKQCLPFLGSALAVCKKHLGGGRDLLLVAFSAVAIADDHVNAAILHVAAPGLQDCLPEMTAADVWPGEALAPPSPVEIGNQIMNRPREMRLLDDYRSLSCPPVT